MQEPPAEDSLDGAGEALGRHVLVLPLLEDTSFVEKGLPLGGLFIILLQDLAVTLGVKLIVLLALVVDLQALLHPYHHVILGLRVLLLEALPLLVELGQLLLQLGAQLLVSYHHQLLEEEVVMAVLEYIHHVVGGSSHQ